ncbi:MAG: hypothetical protein MRY78_07565 [Saprospiraceae bacterium]|nr:hypothetical protein [Saprospiraceae bacterium]
MKKNILLFGVVIALFACQQEETASPAAMTEPLATSLTSADGWRISLLVEDGENKTEDFSSYLFVFAENGVLTASKPGKSIRGTYWLYFDDGETELGMAFPDSYEFDELNDDWYLVSKDQNTIRFNDSGDVLAFQLQQ